MRVVEQLIEHLRTSGHLTDGQIEAVRRMGLIKEDPDEILWSDPADQDALTAESDPQTDDWHEIGDQLIANARKAAAGRRGSGAKRWRSQTPTLSPRSSGPTRRKPTSATCC
jgi:hypothetical protein